MDQQALVFQLNNCAPQDYVENDSPRRMRLPENDAAVVLGLPAIEMVVGKQPLDTQLQVEKRWFTQHHTATTHHDGDM